MAQEQIFCCYLDTPLGRALAAASAEGLTGFWFAGQKYYPKGVEGWTQKDEHPVFVALRKWLGAYFAGENPAPTFACAPRGTAFQKAVWDMLLKIPYGKLTTYGDIAHKLAQKGGKASMSAQAVGGAVGHNPISLVIPCHRVVGASGKLTGYAGGLDKKEALLKLEKAI